LSLGGNSIYDFTALVYPERFVNSFPIKKAGSLPGFYKKHKQY